MGKGYNNYMCKKPFHPGSKANIKRSWMAEQRTENEKKKQDELRIQYEKEQDLYNNKALLSNESKDKLALNFMYEAPPGAKRERQKEDDEPEYKFDWQRKYNAPREDFAKDNKDIKDQPFGIPVRNVRCIKCHNWGHINTDKECPLYNQAHSSSMPTTSMDPLELMQQMREDGLSLKQNILGHQLDMNQSNQQFLTSDEEDPEMEFLKSLTTKQKKKLLRKLNKLSKKEGKKEIKAKKKKKKQKKLKEKKDSKKLKQKTKKVKPKKHISSTSNSSSSNSSNSGSDSETTTSGRHKTNKKPASKTRSSSSSCSESETEIPPDKHQKLNSTKARTESLDETYQKHDYQSENNDFHNNHYKNEKSSNAIRESQRSKTDEKSNYWKTQKDYSYSRRTDYENSYQERRRYEESHQERERRSDENYRYNNRHHSRSPDYSRRDNYSDYSSRDHLRYNHYSYQRDGTNRVKNDNYRNEYSYQDDRGRNLPPTGRRTGYGRERMDNNHHTYRSDFNRDDRSPLRNYSDRRRRSRSPYSRK